MYVCMHVCIYILVYVYMYVHMYMHVYKHTYILGVQQYKIVHFMSWRNVTSHMLSIDPFIECNSLHYLEFSLSLHKTSYCMWENFGVGKIGDFGK